MKTHTVPPAVISLSVSSAFSGPLHAVSSPTPVPHWVVLIVAVLGLWTVIGGGVLVIDGVFRWVSRSG